MQFQLEDGTVAHLKAVVQVEGYQRPYSEQPSDALQEIKRLARLYMPTQWPETPLVVIGLEGRPADELLKTGRLPKVLCVGEFVSNRFKNDEFRKAVFLHVVWLQDELAPHMTDENRKAFSRLAWDNYLPATSA